MNALLTIIFYYSLFLTKCLISIIPFQFITSVSHKEANRLIAIIEECVHVNLLLPKSLDLIVRTCVCYARRK